MRHGDITLRTLSATNITALNLTAGGVLDIHSASESVNPLTMPGGRLTADPADPIAANVATASILYYMPYSGNLIPFRNSAGRWRLATVSNAGLSLNITTLNAGNYDIFLNNGLLAAQAWTNDSTRSIALEYLQGVLVGNYSATDKRTYLGTVRLTGTNGNVRLADDYTRRFIWNAHNQATKTMWRSEPATSWTYSSSTGRIQNGNPLNQVEYVCGQPAANTLTIYFNCRVEAGPSVGAFIGLSMNGAGIDNAYCIGLVTDLIITRPVSISPGYYYFQAIEAALNGTVTFRGASQYGLKGELLC